MQDINPNQEIIASAISSSTSPELIRAIHIGHAIAGIGIIISIPWIARSPIGIIGAIGIIGGFVGLIFIVNKKIKRSRPQIG